MIDVSMICFVIAHCRDHFSQPGIRRQIPVFNGDLRSRDVLTNAIVNIGEVFRVTVYGLFFKVPDDAMRGSGRAKIDQKEKVVEDALRHQNKKAFEFRWFGNMNECHQVHPLVFRLIQ